MKQIDYIEKWMQVAARDQSKKIHYLRALMRETLWFPVDYHPELGDPFEPRPNDPIPFWIGENEEGDFIPIFSSPKVMRLEMKRFDRRHTRARMKGSDLIDALSRTNYTVLINPGGKVTGRLSKEALDGLVSGEAFEERDWEDYLATFNVLVPDAWPEEWRTRLKEECEAQTGVIAVWLATVAKGSENVDPDALHIPVWVRDRHRTPIDGITRAVRLAFPGQKCEFVRLDEKHNAEAIAALRALPPVFPR